MHPALHRDNLRRLPLTMRLAANAAISADRTVADVRRVQGYIATASRTQARWTLPVFYTNLDTAELPDLDTFDTEAPPPDTVSAIGRALVSLYSLYAMKSLEITGADLWPRVWPWARFLHVYRAQLPGSPPDESDFCLSFLSFARLGLDHPGTLTLMMATPWFWYMLAQAWIHLPTISGLRSKLVARNDLTWFLVQDQVTDPANMAQLIEGVGGTLAHLAQLVLLFIDGIVPADEASMDQTLIDYLDRMLTFVGLVEPALQDPFQATAVLGPFGKALLARNIIPILIRAFCSLSNSPAPPTLTALCSCFDLLAGLFLTSDGYATMPEALDAGLLRALVMSAQCSFANDVHEKYYKLYFTLFLPYSLVHYRFLSALAVALHGITHLVDTTAFKQCSTYEMWTEFLSLANERLEVLTTFDSSRSSRNVKACDNLQCSNVDVKNAFRRCSGCLSFYYCSQICQITDWRHGGHREACSSYGTLFLSAKNDEESTARQRSFLRTLVQYDYQKAQSTLLSKQTSFMNAHPGKPFLIIHDYSKGRVKMWIKSVTIVDAVEEFTGVEWKSILSPRSCKRYGNGNPCGWNIPATRNTTLRDPPPNQYLRSRGV
ncbi:MYND-type domain-containing protein [Mycena sanguinolenta]|uniref:MYND-type domain-containing protein n=1 Tax=Mycena sanguinolenta TaxID=230812 RepID=A0A8H6XUQ7_9AGAR|nr:MYND-type domain-containing protein [Mycena sanguinolenta]